MGARTSAVACVKLLGISVFLRDTPHLVRRIANLKCHAVLASCPTFDA